MFYFHIRRTGLTPGPPRRREEAIPVIIINSSSVSTAKLTDRSVVSMCMLGASNLGTGLSGIRADRSRPSPLPPRVFSPVSAMSDRPRHWKQ